MSRFVMAATVLVAAAVTPAGVHAQDFWVAGVGAHATWRPAPAAADTATFSGLMIGGAGGVGWGRMSLEAGYWEGRLTPDDPATERPVLVEAFAALRFRPIAGVAIGGGPYARAHVMDADVRRWLLWQIRGRYETTLVDPHLTGYAELWSRFAGSGGADAPDGARGGGAGLILEFTPLAVRISYVIDDARLDAAGRHETLERLTLAVGVGRP